MLARQPAVDLCCIVAVALPRTLPEACSIEWTWVHGCMDDNTDGAQHWVQGLGGSKGGCVPAALQPWWAARVLDTPMCCPG